MKPQRVYAEIDIDAICSNIRWFMNHVGRDTKVMAVVKTDAYGHGAVPVAQALSNIGVYGFAVATVNEGVELRTSGIENPVLILGHVFQDELERGIQHGLSFTVFSYENAYAISECAGNAGVTAHIHIKVDTGMGRIGFQPCKEAEEEIKKIISLPHISADGIFTHFALADAADKTSMNNQTDKFKRLVTDLEADGISFPIRHMCNSAAAMEKDDDFYDMVRVGITLYGLWPSDEVNKSKLPLKPALSLVSHISQVKSVGEGFTVGYGSTYVTSRPTDIATVPVGYGDGYPRSLSNKGYVLIHGKRAPIIGRICMDQFMVDVTEIKNVKQCDEAVLIGTQKWPSADTPLITDNITVEELSALSGRFNYEFVCDINKRVPRIYKS